MLYYWIKEKFSKHGELLQVHGNSKIVSINSFKDGLPWYHYYQIYEKSDKHGKSFVSEKMRHPGHGNITTRYIKHNTVYGNITTDDESISKYKWSIRYSIKTSETKQHFNYFKFGITSDNFLHYNDIYTKHIIDFRNKSTFYFFNTTSRTKESNYNGARIDTFHLGCEFFNEGIIHLLLDMEKNKLTFSVNTNSKQYNIDQNVPNKRYIYRLAISMYEKEGNECELINFEVFHK